MNHTYSRAGRSAEFALCGREVRFRERLLGRLERGESVEQFLDRMIAVDYCGQPRMFWERLSWLAYQIKADKEANDVRA
jgi:hypothetical protein